MFFILKKTIFLEQFNSPLVWILIFALFVSIFLKEELDAIVIGVIIILNAVLGFIQEYRAEKSIEALQQLASLKAKVIRNGKEVFFGKVNSLKHYKDDVKELVSGQEGGIGIDEFQQFKVGDFMEFYI